MTAKLEIDALRTLLAIESQGGVTRAADHMHLSQSAVSHKIKRLEQALDCTLLARRSGDTLFTDAGKRLLEYARRMIDLQDETIASLRQMKLKGSIQIGMTEDTTSSGLARILGRFSRLYPDVSVRTKINQSKTLATQIENAVIDVAVMQVFKTEVQPDDLVLYEDNLHWVKSKEFILSPNALIPFLAFDEQCFYKHWATTQGQSNGHEFDTVFECSSVAGILAAVKSGMGVALLNDLHLAPDLDIITDIFPSPPEVAYVVRINPSKRKTEAVLTLVDEINREIKNAIPQRVA
ncbi:LysR family transcriptional regulator [Vibrio sp. JC009]|uniref:LysR family transcriptional regulator n=1 Tax=Vibrio sp. JC009 TaxID=2912314 RepID=UPI0023AE6F40|nr:LysR family transcriptional regulator [Vibrio sp. JC009]WED23027.1 LysR family transcriptional regulator [Vibrio sp. JC009]